MENQLCFVVKISLMLFAIANGEYLIKDLDSNNFKQKPLRSVFTRRLR